MSKRDKVYYATRGHLTGAGASKTLAKAELDKQIDWALRVASPVVEFRFGLILVLASTPNGWQHSIVDPTDMEHGKRKDCCTMHGQIEYSDALLRVRSHAAQWAWNHDIADDEAFIRDAGLIGTTENELRSWIAWQRRYAALVAQGKTANEAHSLASGFPAR